MSLIAKKLIGIAVATAVVGALIGLYVSSYLLSYPKAFASSQSRNAQLTLASVPAAGTL